MVVRFHASLVFSQGSNKWLGQSRIGRVCQFKFKMRAIRPGCAIRCPSCFRICGRMASTIRKCWINTPLHNSFCSSWWIWRVARWIMPNSGAPMSGVLPLQAKFNHKLSFADCGIKLRLKMVIAIYAAIWVAIGMWGCFSQIVER